MQWHSNPIGGPDEGERALSVSELNFKVRQLLEVQVGSVRVSGELTNLSRPSSGHWYFTLKDDQAQIRCAMFRGHNQRLSFRPANGDQVIVRGRTSLYEARGDYQLIVEHMQPAGLGTLQQAFEALKQRLSAEGLFEPSRKRPIDPLQIRHIAVITSATGAALQDILHVLEKRAPWLRVTLLPVAVQGREASAQIRTAIEQANRCVSEGREDFDLILCGRGGGSLEDLWCFNEEIVVRAIATSVLPVVSAVGHETDVTLADFAADLRAPTPSAAAERISPERDALEQRIALLQRRLRLALEQQIARHQQTLHHLQRRLRHPSERLQQQAQRVDQLELRLQRAAQRLTQTCQQRLQQLQTRLESRSPQREQPRRQALLDQLAQRLQQAMQQRLAQQQQRLHNQMQLLHSVSPLAVLERGYAIVQREDAHVVRSAAQVQVQESLKIRLHQGSLNVTVTDRMEASS